jgi:hypothetical protein
MNTLFKFIYKQPKFLNFNTFLFSNKTTAVETSEPKIPEFVKVDDRTPKQLQDMAKNANNEMLYHYGSLKRSTESQKYNKMEFVAKKMRHAWFRAGDVYHSHKHIIPVKRLRTKEDTIFKLLEKGEIACVLQGREEFDELHFVLDKKYTKHLDSKPMANTRTMYLKFDNQEEVRVTMIDKERHLSTYLITISP